MPSNWTCPRERQSASQATTASTFCRNQSDTSDDNFSELQSFTDGRRCWRPWTWTGAWSEQEVIPPIRALTRTFSGFHLSEDLNTSRVFGGIERRIRRARPSKRKELLVQSFSEAYKQQHHHKPHVVAFVNSRSGGETGQELKKALTKYIAHEAQEADADSPFSGEVVDLCLPQEPAATLEAIAERRLDDVRLVVCGGDGTVTWILTAMQQCDALKGKLDSLPVAIIPLGTGNDLARSLGWGSKLRSLSDLPDYLKFVCEATPVNCDQWRVVLRPHERLPGGHKLLRPGSHPQRVDDEILAQQLRNEIQTSLVGIDEGATANCSDVYLGCWQNYFSIGMDAKVAGYVDASRNGTTCGRGFFRLGFGKFCYAWQGLRLLQPTRTLTRLLTRFRIKSLEEDVLQDIQPPLAERQVRCSRGRFRQFMFVNINSYGAGLNVLRGLHSASPKPAPSDRILEMLGIRNVAHQLIFFMRGTTPTYIASPKQLAFRLSAGEWMQLDGEPWRLNTGCDVLVEWHREIRMLCAPPTAPFWKGHISRIYWYAEMSTAHKGHVYGFK